MAWGVADPNTLLPPVRKPEPVKIPDLRKQPRPGDVDMGVEQTDDQLVKPGQRLFSTISVLNHTPSRDLINRSLRL